MSKFKVGDKVRVIDNPERMKKYYNIGSTTFDNFTESMLDLRGKVLTIRIIHSNGKYAVDENSHNWTDEMFSGLATEQPRREFIVIRRSGAKTIAELRHDREVIKSAVATCSEKDTFDFETGAKIAFDRLIGREEAKPAPKPAHRFKVGDRVKTTYGLGTVVDYQEDYPHCPYTVEHDDCHLYFHDGQRKNSKRFKADRCYWMDDDDLSHAPAPKAEPKLYTGKVKLVKSCGCYECDHIIGKVFEISEGKLPGFIGAWGQPFSSFSDFVSKRHNKNWIEVKD